MEDTEPSVAPLNIAKKGKAGPRVPYLSFSTSTYHNNYGTRQQQHLQMTPPLTPHDSMEESREPAGTDRVVFHNYLRAFYPFHPSGSVSPSTVTLPLDQGDIILVHSVHVNGWADGTLLENGARGWLPTNYCEAYDQLPMRPLLKALTDFWDIIRGGCGSDLKDFGNQDLMRGLVAGVRFLLEKSECLTRESTLVQNHDRLRRNRKILLSDLSSLVKIAKKLQDVANGAPLNDAVENILDEMLLKAFKIVTRGVRFLDVWNEEVGLSRAMEDLEQPGDSLYDSPLTPPSDTFPLAVKGSSVMASIADRRESREFNRSRLNASRASSARTDMYDFQPRSASVQTKRVSVSHRVSYSAPSAGARNGNLASERLGVAYDGFLGVLGSFIGLHLQSRSSTELILTTQQSVQSCRALLSVVEAVCEHDLHRSELLEEAKDAMYERITELVHAARDAFRPANAADDELIFMPDEGKRLVDAATDCVRGAGNCVAKARLVLEQIGDFELEPVGQGFEVPDMSTPQPQHPDEMEVNTDKPHEPSMRLPPPPLQIPSGELTPTLTDGTTPSSFYSRLTATSPANTDQRSSVYSTASPYPGLEPHIISSETSPTDAQQDYSFESRGVTSTGSNLTYKSNVRDSEMSGMSQTSTRATSPDIHSQHREPSLKGSVSHSTLAEESEETEANILEKTYAHELMFKDGQVVGGSLRALIEKLTAHQSTPDAMFVATFYLTFRLFASPLEFAQGLAERYDYIGDTPHAAGPVRLRVYNVFKGWLESHWRHDCDNVALDFIVNFAKTKLMATIPTAGKRLLELADKVSAVHGPVVPRLVSSIGKTNTSIAQYVHPDTPLPPPIITKSQLNMLRQWQKGGPNVSILDFDPLELARQFTIKESRIFCSILPEELLATEWMKKSGSLAVNVRAMSTLSTDLANLVADSILQLEEPKKRAVIIKQWVKIASRCLDLNNYDSLMAIICSLNSSTISRLKRTWELVSQKTKASLEHLRGVVDVSRNYAVLRQRLQNHVPPCLPFVGTYLTDLTFVDHGNQPVRNLPTEDGAMAVINFDKHMKTAKIISELQRFQIPYRLTEVPELQTWMQDQLIRVRSNGEKSFQSYYRRSLVLEPREMQRATTESSQSIQFKENGKDKFDFLAWTHSSKAKGVTTTS
ncbi:putative ras guanine-nucleotide exchange protein [Paecilomyces variotii]|uniref:Putative ras guanine-nucleotide exchange protein n=1 Tax=Byssochlamys spectabilis TaxID=264951 RepID=A0A443I004_BYSSP|nr:putative ras guanine-nucleotide exchange protein [Paecilomyces variotii]RWQ97395.1 putative ras guanine-nucleotide exchange protein [Paecilomyces variotii]